MADKTESLTYAGAGVDIDESDRIVEEVISGKAMETFVPGMMGTIGGFGGLFSLKQAGFSRAPVLVMGTDGVGTKLRIAFMTGKHDSIGIDLVAMCVNDVAVQGAKPLCFLDYIATGKIEEGVIDQIVSGIVKGCKQAGCGLIGGETAEMPDSYPEGEYDVSGFAVGAVMESKIIDGSQIKVGDRLLGIASSGLHSNGYSLVRKICFNRLGLEIGDHVDVLGKTIGEELLTPTKIYVNTIRSIMNLTNARGFSHITGGGLGDNISRIIPLDRQAMIYRHSWPVPPIFPFLQEAGNVTDVEMLRAFNNGIGLVAVIPKNDFEMVRTELTMMGEEVYAIGEVVKRTNDEKILWRE
jgi:phosphoribosylformylglycinamidine cyclo-ligase